MKLQFKIENEHIKLMSLSDYPVSDSINYLTASFEFDSEWDGFAKTALFSNGNGSRCVLLENDECVIPWETLTGRFLYISAYGVKDNVRITATEIKIPIAPSGYCEGETPQPPTPTVYEQILQKLSEVTQNGGSGEITDGSITSEKLADGAVTYSKLDDYTKSEISAAGSQAYEKAEEAMVAASGALAECGQLRHQVITNSSLITSEQTVREEADAALESSLEWKQIGETVQITQEDIDAAGEDGITALTLDLGAPVTEWYGETMIDITIPKANDINTFTTGRFKTMWGKTLEQSLGAAGYIAIVSPQTNNSLLSPAYNQRHIITSNWDEKEYLTHSLIIYKANGGASGYPSNPFATETTTVRASSIIGKQFLSVYGLSRPSGSESDINFKFPAGSKLTLYGRF